MRGHPVLCYLAPGPDFSGSQHPPRLLAQLLLGGKTDYSPRLGATLWKVWLTVCT